MDPVARRAHAPWRDLRLVLGLLLVIASISAVWFIVTTSRTTSPVLQATRTILVGEVLSSADLRAVEVGLGSLAGEYLAQGELAPGTIALRTITAGELLPRSATGAASDAATTTVVIDSAVGVSESVSPGTRVEVWSAAPDEDRRGFEPPVVLVRSATVAAVVAPSGLISQGQTKIELIVDRAEVGPVLTALTDGSALSIVPLAGGGS